MKNGHIAILAGGGGTRLWPLSRKNLPKQFLKLVNSKTLLQNTFNRVKDRFPKQNIHVVTSRQFVPLVKKQIPGMLLENILIEPSGKNTAAAAGLAAAVIHKKDPDSVVTVVASDHYIKERAKFLKVLDSSQQAAVKGPYIVTIGIKPTGAHTGLGYIHIDGEAFRVNKSPIFKVESFKEKPDQLTAYAYVASGEYFWNANINTYKTKTILDAIKKHLPQLSKVLSMAGRDKFEKEWGALTPEAIDTAILEKSKNVLMVPGNISWFDIGDWSSLYELVSNGRKKNIFIDTNAEHVHFGSEGNLFYGKKKLLATYGLKDMVVVETEDVLLICPKVESQEVKKIVEQLLKKKKTRYL